MAQQSPPEVEIIGTYILKTLHSLDLHVGLTYRGRVTHSGALRGQTGPINEWRRQGIRHKIIREGNNYAYRGAQTSSRHQPSDNGH